MHTFWTALAPILESFVGIHTDKKIVLFEDVMDYTACIEKRGGGRGWGGGREVWAGTVTVGSSFTTTANEKGGVMYWGAFERAERHFE